MDQRDEDGRITQEREHEQTHEVEEGLMTLLEIADKEHISKDPKDKEREELALELVVVCCYVLSG